MDLKATIQNDMKTAMKAQEPDKVSTLRMLISEIKKREIDKKTQLDEAEIHKTISTLVKQRQDSIEAFTKGGRDDLANKEKQEIEFLKIYLPAQLGDAELEALVVAAIAETQSTSPNDIGKVMKAVMAKAGGRAEGRRINEIARGKLSS